MKLNIKEITKATAPKFWIYDPEQIEQTIDYVDLSNYTDDEYAAKIKSIRKNQPSAELFDSFESAIDNLRTIDFIKNFDTTTITYYMEYLTNAIRHRIPVYVIRERKGSPITDYYVDKSYINMIKYTLLNGGKWRLRTESVDKYIITTHNASSLGLTIFFDERNAQARLARLKGGLN